MQLQSRFYNHQFTKDIIQTTTDFIDRTFDVNFGVTPSKLLQMPADQLNLFATQSLQNKYLIVVTMLNEEQFQGKLIKSVNENKYIMRINSGFYKIFNLNDVKSINQSNSI